jgi:hypothetical protein
VRDEWGLGLFRLCVLLEESPGLQAARRAPPLV